jgi:hypothetical protein
MTEIAFGDSGIRRASGVNQRLSLSRQGCIPVRL